MITTTEIIALKQKLITDSEIISPNTNETPLNATKF